MSEKIARLVGAVAGLVLGAGIGLFVVFAVREFGGGAAVFVIGGGTVFLFLVTLLLYSAAAGSRARSVETSEACRAALVSMNSALNVVILDTFLPSVAAGFMGLVVILAASWTISRNVGYKILAGWSNWLLPTSWPIVGLGLVFAVLSLLGAVLTFLQLDFFKPHCFRVNAGTGSLFIHGGLVGNLNPYGAAFNMGNFTFVSRNSTSYHVDATENLFHHEAGHSLNLAAFGSLFHLIGVVDEVFSNGKQAFAERLAEGNAPVPDDPAIPMWGLTADRA